MSSPYRSPTKRLAVEILTDDGRRGAGEIHLHPNTRAPGGFETPLTMIDNEDAFFPLSEENGTVVLMGKARTISVSYVPPEDLAAAGPDPSKARAALDLHLSDGSLLSGWTSLDLPKAQARTLDVLNGPERFLTIHTEDRVHLVNRSHIRSVHPRD